MASRTGRSRHRLILLALTAITLLTVDLNNFGPAQTAQRLVRDAIHPVTSLAATVFSPVGDVWNSVFNYGDLEDENAALRAELDDLRGSAMQAETDTETLRQLLEATELPYVGDLETVTAEVARRAVGNFADHVITINKGSRHGIAPDMAVVTGAGLVGRVVDVDSSTSTVRLLSDSSLVVGLRLVSTGDVGLGHAVPGDSSMLVVDRGLSWPDVDDPSLLPSVGSVVVTSSESIFPSDIPVGTVAESIQGDDDVSMEVTVELAADVENLQFVSVVLVQPPEQLDLGEVVPSTTLPTTTDGGAEDGATDGGATGGGATDGGEAGEADQ